MHIVFTAGIPDNQSPPDRAAIRRGVAFPGNAGLLGALKEAARERGWRVSLEFLGRAEDIDLDGADLVLNCICDPVLQQRSLWELARLVTEWPVPVLNYPWAVLGTGRANVSRVLAHQVDVRVPLTTRCRDETATFASHLERAGHRLPILVRPIGRHGSEGLVKIATMEALERLPGRAQDYFFTDFVEYGSPDGFYRKYRIVYVDDRLIRRHLMISNNWNVYNVVRQFMKEHPRLVEEEKAFVDGSDDLGKWIEERLLHQFRALGLEFGAVDFTVGEDQTLTIFEISPCFELLNPSRMTPERSVLWAHVRESNEAVIDALLEAAARRAGTGRAGEGSSKVQQRGP